MITELIKEDEVDDSRQEDQIDNDNVLKEYKNFNIFLIFIFPALGGLLFGEITECITFTNWHIIILIYV